MFPLAGVHPVWMAPMIFAVTTLGGSIVAPPGRPVRHRACPRYISLLIIKPSAITACRLIRSCDERLIMNNYVCQTYLLNTDLAQQRVSLCHAVQQKEGLVLSEQSVFASKLSK